MSAHHLKNLNSAQLEATRHGEGPLLIFAGAGSGKTRVLTRRITNLILEHSVLPSEILAVTFTNKAAGEMKARVANLFREQQIETAHNLNSTWVHTFHSACLRILRSHAALLDFNSDFAIYDKSDSLAALKRVFKRMNLDPKFIDPKMVGARIDKAKNNFETSDEIREDSHMPRQWAELTAEIFVEYQKELHQSNAMDFGDLIYNVVTLFKLDQELLERYRMRFKYILVDEYQDTNQVQYTLVKMLSEKHKNICVVGDDDQSIYAFRGATVENILNFRKDYPDAKVITLDTNYRSTRNILGAANHIIARNKRREKKKMKTSNAPGEVITCHSGYNEKEEARFVVREISKMLANGKNAKDIAIFYRTNAQSRAIEEALCEHNIPYEIFGGQKFYQRKEIKDLISYFKLILNTKDNEALLRIINTPTRGLGQTSVNKLVSLADTERLPIFTCLEQELKNENSILFSSKATRTKFDKFYNLILGLRKDAIYALEVLKEEDRPGEERRDAIAELLKNIAEKSTYLSSLKKQDTPEAQSRIENIFELFRVAVDFSEKALEESGKIRLSDFLDRASLSSDLDKENSESKNENKEFRNFISLMTLHLAKGLEFDTVFLVGLEEGLLPHIRSIDDKTALEEERRLCYVGITRAKKKLYLTRAKMRQSFGRSNWYTGQASRFVYDLPREVINYDPQFFG